MRIFFYQYIIAEHNTLVDVDVCVVVKGNTALSSYFKMGLLWKLLVRMRQMCPIGYRQYAEWWHKG